MKMTRAGPSQKAEHVRSIEPESATLRVPPHAVVTSRGSVYAELRQRLAAGLEFVSSLGGLIAKNISHTESELSVAIAEKWLRNASQRVFSDPHRFLVELVVNGVDATIQRGGSRGQFGMGFLACLEFLGHKETNGTQIKIKSRTEIDDYELNISGALENPQLVIKNSEQARFAKGTTIEILPNQGKFSRETQSKFLKALELLDLQNEFAVDCFIEDKPKIKKIRIGSIKLPAIVEVNITNDKISIADQGSGISLAAAISTLLIPGESSKTRATVQAGDLNVQDIELKRWCGSEDSNQSSLLILVNGVLTVQHTLDHVVRDLESNVQDVVISMPQWARLTLDRDEIILDRPKNSENISAEETYLRKCITLLLDRTLNPDSTTDQKMKHAVYLAATFSALEQWEKTSSSSYLARQPLTRFLVRSVREKLFANTDLIAVSPEYLASVGEILAKLEPQSKVIAIPGKLINYDFSRLEQHILRLARSQPLTDLQKKALECEIIDGKNVIFVDSESLPLLNGSHSKTISTCGLLNTLFVPRTILEAALAAEDLQEAILYRYAEQVVPLNPAKNTTERFITADTSAARLAIVTNSALPKYISVYAQYYLPDPILEGSLCSSLAYVESVFKLRRIFSPEQRELVVEFWAAQRQILMDLNYDRISSKFRIVNSLSEFFSNLESNVHYVIYNISEGEDLKDIRDNFLRAYPRQLLYVCPETDQPVVINAEALYERVLPFIENKVDLVRLPGENADTSELYLGFLKGHNDWYDEIDCELPVNLMFYSQLASLKLISPLELWQSALELNLMEDTRPYLDLDTISPHFPKEPKIILQGKQLWPLTSESTAQDLCFSYNMLMLLRTEQNYHHEPYKVKNAKAALMLVESSAPDLVRSYQQVASIIPRIKVVPEASLEQMQVLSESQAALVQIAAIQAYYQPQMPMLQLHECTAETMAFLDSLIVDSAISGEAAISLQKFKQALLSLTVSYYNFPDGFFAGGYDRKPIPVVRHWKDDFITSQVTSFCKALAVEVDAFQKLIDFQIEQLASVYDTAQWQHDLSTALKVYDLGAPTPITALSELHQKGLASRHIATIVRACESPAEVMFFCQLFKDVASYNQTGRVSNYNRILVGYKTIISGDSAELSQRVDGVIQFFVDRVLREQVGAAHMQTEYEADRNRDPLSSNAINFKRSLSIQLASCLQEAYLEQREPYLKQQSVAIVLNRVQPQYTLEFKLTQLIHAHLNEPEFCQLLRSGLSSELQQLLSRQPTATAGNKLLNCIESATERGSVQAILLEATQNSADAIRDYQSRVGQAQANDLLIDETKKSAQLQDFIMISVQMISTSEQRASLCLTIRDSAGIPDLSVLFGDLLIPDYTRKTVGNNCVGDMGNGFFQLFSDAQEVKLLTRVLDQTDSPIYMLSMKPILDQQGRVYDIHVAAAQVPLEVAKFGPNFRGTELQVILRERDFADAYAEEIFAKFFVHDFLTRADLKDFKGDSIPVSLNETSQLLSSSEISYQPLSQRSIRSLEGVVESQVTIQKGHESIRSLVLTAGLPLMDLERFCRQNNLLPLNLLCEVRSGLRLNLELGSYEPVQSRSELKLTEATKNSLTALLLDAIVINKLAGGMEFSNNYKGFLGNFSYGFSTGLNLDIYRLYHQPHFISKVQKAAQDGCAVAVAQVCTYHCLALLEGFDRASFAGFVEILTKDLLTAFEPICECAREEAQSINKQMTLLATSSDKQTKLSGKMLKRLLEHAQNREKFYREALIEAADPLFSAELRRLEQAKLDNTTALLSAREFLLDCVIPWFEHKINAYQFGFPHDVNRKKADQGVAIDKKNDLTKSQIKKFTLSSNTVECVKLIEPMVTLLQQLLAKKIDPNNLAPTFCLYHESSGERGIYFKQKSIIALNLDSESISISDLVQVMRKIKEGEFLLMDSTFKKLFWPSSTAAGVINHELEHWRQGSDCGLELHQGINLPDGRYVDFEGAAAFHFRRALNEGAVLDWIREIRAQLVASGLNLDAAIQNLETLQANHGLKLLIELNIPRSKQAIVDVAKV